MATHRITALRRILCRELRKTKTGAIIARVKCARFDVTTDATGLHILWKPHGVDEWQHLADDRNGVAARLAEVCKIYEDILQQIAKGEYEHAEPRRANARTFNLRGRKRMA